MAPDPGHAPEWISATVVDATMRTDDGSVAPCRVKVGIVAHPDGGGKRIASQIVGEGRPLVMLPPSSVAPIMGALRRGLLTL